MALVPWHFTSWVPTGASSLYSAVSPMSGMVGITFCDQHIFLLHAEECHTPLSHCPLSLLLVLQPLGSHPSVMSLEGPLLSWAYCGVPSNLSSPVLCFPAPGPYSLAPGPIWQVLALASIMTVALTTGGHTGDTILGAVDQVVAFVAITSEVLVQCI